MTLASFNLPGGVWSAAPTPFTTTMRLDRRAVVRMVRHHLRLGVSGLFLAGTNGEGPWMPDAQREELVRTVVAEARGRFPIAVQVTDNSAARIIANMHRARAWGADIAVIAPPYFLMNASAANLTALYREAILESPLPVGIYDRGESGAVVVPSEVLPALYREKKVVMVKDSSTSPQRMELALQARRERPELVLLNGWEFNNLPYLQAGYDGLLLGGGVFNGYLARLIMDAVAAGEMPRARRLQQRMNRIMWDAYGGKKIECWLAGEKQLLVEMGIFSTSRNYPNYQVTARCARAIQRLVQKDVDVLLPDPIRTS